MDPTVQDIKLVPSVKPLANYTDKNMILRIPMSVLSVDQDMIKVRLPNAKHNITSFGVCSQPGVSGLGEQGLVSKKPWVRIHQKCQGP